MSLLCDREETSEVKGFGGGGGIQDGNGEQSGALGAPILTPWLVCFFWCPWPFS